MSLFLNIEAETFGELMSKTFAALHLPCDAGFSVQLRERAQTPSERPTQETTNIPPEAPTAPTEGEPAKRKRRTKAEIEADALAAKATAPPVDLDAPAAPALADIFGEDVPPPPTGAKITEEQLRAKIQELAAKDNGAGLAQVVPVLHKFGYERIKQIKAEHYDAIAAEIDLVLAK